MHTSSPSAIALPSIVRARTVRCVAGVGESDRALAVGWNGCRHDGHVPLERESRILRVVLGLKACRRDRESRDEHGPDEPEQRGDQCTNPR